MRPRRLASYAFDVLLVFAPWLSMLGLVASPPSGGGMAGLGLAVVLAGMCGVGTLGLLVLQIVVFAARGRTLGMGLVGLVAVGGSRAVALLLGAGVVVLPGVAAFFLGSHLDGTTQLLLEAGAPLGAVAVDLGFALLPGARTLTDRAAGLRWRQGVGPTTPTAAAVTVDAFVGGMLGMPLLLVFAWDDAAGAVIAGAILVALFGMLEVALSLTTRATLGMRTLARLVPG